MELTNGEIFSAVRALGSLFDKELPVDVSIALAEMMSEFDDPFQVIEKVKNSLIKKYGTADKGGTGNLSVQQTSKNWPEFTKEYNKLMTKAAEYKLAKVEVPQEVNGKQITLTPGAVRALGKLVVFVKTALSEGPITEGK